MSAFNHLTDRMVPFLQPAFERLHRLALSGMNCGGRAGDIHNSGELPFLDRLSRFYPSQTALTLVDAGAHAGEYSLAFAERCGQHPGSRVLALEPSPTLFPALQSRFASAKGNVRLNALPVGLGDKLENVPLYASQEPRHAGLSTLYPRRLDHFNITLQSQGCITIDTLDALSTAHALNRIHLLKLDIEGHELPALRGAQRMIQEERIDFIQFEFGGCNIDSRTYFQDFYYLLSPQFTLYRLLPRGYRVLSGYHEEQEVFITTNFVAVRQAIDANFLRD